MKAVVFDKSGPPEVLHLADLEQPAPKEDEVLVKIHATTVNRTDCGVRGAGSCVGQIYKLVGVRPQRNILGTELAGEIEAVGAAVTQFAVGDRVFGLNPGVFGTHAEFVCMREDALLAPIPAGMSFEQAAAISDGATLALMGLKRADLREGRSILVYGASGSIGTACVQLAKHFGAHVTAVCNTKNVETVRSLGADEVIDYTQEDFTRNGKTYDVIADAVGKHSFKRCKASLNPGGLYLANDGGGNIIRAFLLSRYADKKVIFPIPPRYAREDILFLKGLVEAGRYRAVIDRSYPLADVVEATRYVETEQKTGNVVLTVNAAS